MRAVLFESLERYEAFHQNLVDHGIEVQVLRLTDQNWLAFDYTDLDIVIYYPSFQYSSNHPLALSEVYDNIAFLPEC